MRRCDPFPAQRGEDVVRGFGGVDVAVAEPGDQVDQFVGGQFVFPDPGPLHLVREQDGVLHAEAQSDGGNNLRPR